MNLHANATSYIIKVASSISKPTNSIANRPNSTTKATNSTANVTNLIAKTCTAWLLLYIHNYVGQLGEFGHIYIGDLDASYVAYQRLCSWHTFVCIFRC